MLEGFGWHNNLLHAIRTRAVLILHGNVRDQYVLVQGQHHYDDIDLDELLVRLLQPFGPVCRYDAYAKGARLEIGPAQTIQEERLEEFGGPGFNNTLDPSIARIISEVENPAMRRTWLLKYAHNMLPYRNSYSQEEAVRLIALQRMIERIAAPNKIILSYLSDTQVPVEFSQNSHRVAFLKVPLPDYAERLAFWSSRVSDPRIAEDLSKLSDGMALSSMHSLFRLAGDQTASKQPELGAFTLRDWERAIARYKFGETRNFYEQITPERLDSAKTFFVQQEGLRGQEQAVQKAIQMLLIARTNLAALLRGGSSGAPRGVLFCCGPSGTGKTFLSKKLAKFVFGSEAAFHRIDMSEYQQDHTVSKLIGAPPGYVGYEMGGTLTNFVLERPFSVILFDEIEKAHPRVFDLFLQLLSDGRLTDSRGQTVFFSESIIVFTSNIGTRSHEIQQLQEAQRSGDAAQVREHFIRSVRNYFLYEISRPELLNRIGNNIVPFNFLDKEDVIEETIRFYLQSLEQRFNEEYEKMNLRLVIKPDVAPFLGKQYGQAVQEFGGRAVVNTLEDIVLPELARGVIRNSGPGRARGATTITVSVVTAGGVRKVKVDG